LSYIIVAIAKSTNKIEVSLQWRIQIIANSLVSFVFNWIENRKVSGKRKIGTIIKQL